MSRAAALKATATRRARLFGPAPVSLRPTRTVAAYGGGLDSWTELLLAERLRWKLPEHVVFCDVGDPSGQDPGEWPSTYRHMREVVIPWCEARGVAFQWLDGERYPVRGARSLWRYWWGDGQQAGRVTIPGTSSRRCSLIAKVERFERWLAETFPTECVEVWIGFEAGEEERAAKDPHAKGAGRSRRVNRFPLIEQGFCRCRCEALARESGLPVPRKSACVFCPFSSKGDWKTLARELPTTMAEVSRLEAARGLTSGGQALAVMGYDSKKAQRLQARGEVYRPRSTAEWAASPYRPVKSALPCPVCGEVPRASKATGCTYLYDEEPAARAA